MKDHMDSFESAWKRFETNLRGKLLAKARNQSITIGLANVILKDTSAGWLSIYDACGKWLMEYAKESPEKAAIITDIFKYDVKFTKEVKQQTIPSYIKYVVPAVGALIGVGVAQALSAKLIVTLASAAIPAAALYPVTNSIEKNTFESCVDKTVAAYVAQLGVYKTSIMSVLQD